MTDSYTKQLTFKSENLGTFANLVLVFDKPVDGLFDPKMPVVLRSSEFQSDGVSMTSFTYNSQPAFLKPGPLVNKTIVDIATFQALDFGERTTLVLDGSAYAFTTPTPGPTPNVMATNGTNQLASIAFGFNYVNPSRPPTPVYYWPEDTFPVQSTIVTDFVPVLRAYVAGGFQDGQVLTAPINSQVLFEQDLSQLSDTSVWLLTYDDGKFTITPEA